MRQRRPGQQGEDQGPLIARVATAGSIARPAAPPPIARAGWLALAYAAFVVYGSLVPLDWRPYPLDQAWADFQRIPFLRLGVASRADWVANGVLYLPLGLLAARALAGAGLAQRWACALSVAGCLALATAVEFAQLFFPPRTVSQNDLLAEAIGSAAGALALPWASGWIDRLARGWQAGGARLAPRLLEGYALAYLALCFFPYDLLLTAGEIEAKARSGLWSPWLVADARGGFVAALQLAAEAALAAPLGLWLARRHAAGAPPALAAAGLGLLLGLVIEAGQFFVASGVTQGASVLARAIGVAAGAVLAPAAHGAGVAGLRGALARRAGWLAAVYLPLWWVASGAWRNPWQGWDGAGAAWRELRWMPFYYHYYTSEAVALFSLGSVALMAAPPALLAWARGWRRETALAVVGALAAAIEAGKLFVAGQHPDPTNVLIAVVAAALARRLVESFEQRAGAPAAAAFTPDRGAPAGAAPAGAAPAGAATAAPEGAPAASMAAPAASSVATPGTFSPWLLALPAVAAGALTFPVVPGILLVGLALAAAAVWRRPVLALALLPAALPALDLAPWSGRIFWGEFDLLAAATLAVALHRTRGLQPSPLPRWLRAAFALLALSLVVSTLRALWPPAPLDANAFASAASPYNALRIAAGAAWAAVFMAVWRRLSASGVDCGRAFGGGVVAGLALTVAAVVWERVAFVELWDFTSAFRVTGAISAMHHGGAFIECWLAVGSAFALWAVLSARSRIARAGALLLLAAAGYAAMVTYSRNGWAALALALVLTAAVGAAGTRGLRAWRGTVAATVALAVVAAVAALVLQGGSYARERLSQVDTDLATRVAHWRDGLQMRDDSVAAAVFGMGLGRYPGLHRWRSREPEQAGSWGFVEEGGRRLLRLGAGTTVYVQQIVKHPSTGALTLALDLRVRGGAGGLAASLCEKWISTSLRCAEVATFDRSAAAAGGGPDGSGWQRAELRFEASWLETPPGLRDPPLMLALHTPAEGALDVAGLSLRTADGAELLANGDFARGMDRWFTATNAAPPWQLDSLPVTVLFDQGWLGLLAWGVLVAGALTVALRAAGLRVPAPPAVPAAAPAVCAFLVSGSLNTLIDAPRFLWLLLVLLWAAAAAPGAAGGGRGLR